MNFDPRDYTPIDMGGWQSRITNKPVQLQHWQIEVLEKVLNQQYLPSVRRRFREQYPPGNLSMNLCDVPAPVVRFDMAPMTADPSDRVGVYEIEANTAGHAIAMRLGIPMDQYLAKSLCAMGINRIGYAVSPSRQSQAQDLEELMVGISRHGVDACLVDLMNGVPDDTPLWLRAGQEDLHTDGPVLSRFSQCLQWHLDGGGSKSYLFDIDPTVKCLSDVDLSQIPDYYDSGIVLKQIGGWGTRGVEVFTRNKPHSKHRTTTVSKLRRTVDSIVQRKVTDDWIIQEFVPPEAIAGGYVMWRVMGVYDPVGKAYRVVGGVWNWRPSTLRLHGASDAVFGPILP